jgi:hypothetical protein
MINNKDIGIQANKIGLMEFPLEKGAYKVEMILRETPLRLTSDIISICTFGTVIIGLFFKRKHHA